MTPFSAKVAFGADLGGSKGDPKMVKNLRPLRGKWVLEAIWGQFCAVARLFSYFGPILAAFRTPPGPIWGQFGDFTSFFCCSIAFFAFLFFLFVFWCLWLVGRIGVVGRVGVVGGLQ